MAVFKCKICGGTLEINEGETVATCEYCGTKQTLPKLDDEKKANLFDRANHFRRNNDFDKAMGIYEQILNEDTEDAESYWSIVLCRYGIEYVEDPSSRKRIPTVNRAQFTSVFDDEDYKSAIKYADSYQKNIYEAEAAAINEIQKGILAISQKEEPFDVFICYKETDNNGRRTQDSVLATELYHELTKEGFKVFFSRITLEDKLGVAYEPYIFAALHSAKVMVVLGTKPEHFNAVWVKNEWSRYLSLIKNGANKILIPAYRDMDPYDLPEEFSHLQAQDMSKLGFMQDLVRGIKKLVSADGASGVKETVVVQSAASGNTNIEPLLKRAFMFLEDGDFIRADEFCEQVLNIDPENDRAYLGKLMAELGVKTQDRLADCAEPFDTKNNYKKFVRFADDNLKNILSGYLDIINDRNKNAEIEKVYQSAKSISNNNINSLFDQENAISLFESVIECKDAKEQIEICRERIEKIKIKQEKERLENERKAEQDKIIAEERRKRNKKIAIIVTPIILVLIIIIILIKTVIIPNIKYNDAIALMDAGKYNEAITAFEEMNGYKDSNEKSLEINYAIAMLAFENGVFERTMEQLEVLEEFANSKEQIGNIKKSVYESIPKSENVEVGKEIIFGGYEQDNVTDNGKEAIEWLVLTKEGNKVLIISKYALDCQPYNTTKTDVTWENCFLRKWLNNEFINSSFTDDQKTLIQNTLLINADNSAAGTSGGNDTQDKVFLLNIDEANKYFTSDDARRVEATAYAKAQGAYVADNGDSTWWLRSPGCDSKWAATIGDDVVLNYDGSIRYRVYGCVSNIGSNVDRDEYTVRPAMWLSLEND